MIAVVAVLSFLAGLSALMAVMAVIGGFQNFDQIFIMTRGGPEFESATYMVYLYQNGFQYFKGLRLGDGLGAGGDHHGLHVAPVPRFEEVGAL